MKKLITSLALIPLLFAAGCSSVKISPALVRTGVSTGVSYGVAKYPQAVPGVRIAAEVICSAANSTNLSPANVVAAVQQASPNITPETTLIINGALLLYIGVWNSYGQDAVNNAPALKEYLQATCAGINDGLPPLSAVPMLAKPVAVQWPLVKSK